MAYDPYRSDWHWQINEREGPAVSAWSLGILVAIVLGLLVFTANYRNANLSLNERAAWSAAETTAGPANRIPQWPAPPSQFE